MLLLICDDAVDCLTDWLTGSWSVHLLAYLWLSVSYASFVTNDCFLASTTGMKWAGRMMMVEQSSTLYWRQTESKGKKHKVRSSWIPITAAYSNIHSFIHGKKRRVFWRSPTRYLGITRLPEFFFSNLKTIK